MGKSPRSPVINSTIPVIDWFSQSAIATQSFLQDDIAREYKVWKGLFAFINEEGDSKTGIEGVRCKALQFGDGNDNK